MDLAIDQMNALYQRLRDLDPKAFEDLCFQIISARHPDANITRANGAGGDMGVDIFQGDLAENPTVWQCKFFPNGVRSPQKVQIRKSLRVVLQHFKPRRWILCLPIDLNANGHTWFQQLKKEYAHRTDVGLFQASQIVRELLHRRAIRNMFFPGAVLEPTELRSILAHTGEYSDRELHQLTLENVEQYLQRLRDRDARFDYQVMFLPHGDLHPHSSPLPGLIATVTDADKRIDVFARDIEALQLDPPKVHVTVKGEGARKLQHAIETGNSVELGPGELSHFRSSFDFLLSGKPDPQSRVLKLEPLRRHRSKQFQFKTMFGARNSAVLYESIPFSVARQGTKEVELISVDQDLPFRMSMVFPISPNSVPHEASFSLQARFIGREVRAVRKFVMAMKALKESGNIELWDVQREVRFFEAKMSFELFPEASESLLTLLDEVCEIADVFRARIRFPKTVSQEDQMSISLLLALGRGGEAGLEVQGISCTLTKSAAHEGVFLDALDAEQTFRFEVGRVTPMPRVFGTEVDTGPCLVVAERATITDKERVKRKYLSAAEGEGVVVHLRLLKPATVILRRAVGSEIGTDGQAPGANRRSDLSDSLRSEG